MRWYRCLDRAITWADGRIVRYELAVDITDRREAEEALRKSEEKYRYLTESMNDIVWTTDLEMNTTYVSPSIEKVLGFTIEERMQQSLIDQLTPETLATTAEMLVGELENDPEGDPDRSISLDLNYYHKMGPSGVWRRGCLSFATRRSSVRHIWIVTDVTERKRAHEALSGRRKNTASFSISNPICIFLIDNETGRNP